MDPNSLTGAVKDFEKALKDFEKRFQKQIKLHEKRVKDLGDVMLGGIAALRKEKNRLVARNR
jgi:hypothetical protein